MNELKHLNLLNYPPSIWKERGSLFFFFFFYVLKTSSLLHQLITMHVENHNYAEEDMEESLLFLSLSIYQFLSLSLEVESFG